MDVGKVVSAALSPLRAIRSLFAASPDRTPHREQRTASLDLMFSPPHEQAFYGANTAREQTPRETRPRTRARRAPAESDEEPDDTPKPKRSRRRPPMPELDDTPQPERRSSRLRARSFRPTPPVAGPNTTSPDAEEQSGTQWERRRSRKRRATAERLSPLGGAPNVSPGLANEPQPQPQSDPLPATQILVSQGAPAEAFSPPPPTQPLLPSPEDDERRALRSPPKRRARSINFTAGDSPPVSMRPMRTRKRGREAVVASPAPAPADEEPKPEDKPEDDEDQPTALNMDILLSQPPAPESPVDLGDDDLAPSDEEEEEDDDDEDQESDESDDEPLATPAHRRTTMTHLDESTPVALARQKRDVVERPTRRQSRRHHVIRRTLEPLFPEESERRRSRRQPPSPPSLPPAAAAAAAAPAAPKQPLPVPPEFEMPPPVPPPAIVQRRAAAAAALALGGTARTPVARAVSRLRRQLAAPFLPDKIVGWEPQQTAAASLVERAVERLENVSGLLVGPRGCGKSLVLRHVLRDARERRPAVVITLNGLVQTDDAAALQEITAQLAVSTPQRATFAENMAFLLEVLRDGAHAEMPCVFVLEEFDAFAARSKQKLLYTLLDLTQSPRAHLSVIGLTHRLDVVELLEKRVKSRYSHMQILFHYPELGTLRAIVEAMGQLPPEEDGGTVEAWNAAWVAAVAGSEELLRRSHALGRPLRWFNRLVGLAAVRALLPGAGAEERGGVRAADLAAAAAALEPPPMRELLSGVSVLELLVLLAMRRLERAECVPYNFESVFDEYQRFVASERQLSYTRAVIFKAFEHLADMELVVFVAGGGTLSMLKQFQPVRTAVPEVYLRDVIRSGKLPCPTALAQWGLGR